MSRGGWQLVLLLGFLLLAARQGDDQLQRSAQSICQIQGDGFASPYVGEVVTIQGVVTADLDSSSKKGFFLQEENCDGDPATSDGVFIYLGAQGQFVDAGDRVEITGSVQEYFGLTEIVADYNDISVLSSGNKLPEAVDLNPPLDNDSALAYFEAIEGMYARLDDSLVVGPTNKYDETFVVRSDLGIERVFRDDPLGTGEVICVDDRGLFEITPPSAVGDRVMDLVGVVDYAFGLYRLQLVEAPTHLPAATVATSPTPPASLAFSFGTFNLENLFDRVDDPETEDSIPSQTRYERKLAKLALAIHQDLGEPTFLAIQEAENAAVLSQLVNQSPITSKYAVLLVEGPDKRGIDVGLLYQPGNVTILAYEQRQGCTTLVDGLGPDGNRDVQEPANDLTCDTDDDGVNDGNRLFSRPPLVVELLVDLDGKAQNITVIINHWKSKSEDTPSQEYTLPRRLEQAHFVAALAQDFLNADPGAFLVVLGDFNDTTTSQPIQILESTGLTNLLALTPKPQRYTYIYQGISQVLDHILVSPAMLAWGIMANPVHINADYPYAAQDEDGTTTRSSDHDPVLANQSLTRFFLPFLSR